MAKGKPRVLATRHFPPDVETRLAANFDAVLNPQDKLYDGARLAEASKGCDAIMCAAGDPLNAETIGKLAGSVKMIATFSVGYEHIDVAAAAKKGIAVSNTPDVLTDATADIAMLCLLGAARHHQHQIDRGERGQDGAAGRFVLHRTRRPFQAFDGRIAVEPHHENVPERGGLPKISCVASVEDVETPVGDDQFLPAFPEPLPPNRKVFRTNHLYLCVDHKLPLAHQNFSPSNESSELQVAPWSCSY